MSAAVHIWKAIDIIATWQSQNEIAKRFNSKGYKSSNHILFFVVWTLIVSRVVSWTICIPFPVHTIQMKIRF